MYIDYTDKRSNTKRHAYIICNMYIYIDILRYFMIFLCVGRCAVVKRCVFVKLPDKKKKIVGLKYMLLKGTLAKKQ